MSQVSRLTVPVLAVAVILMFALPATLRADSVSDTLTVFDPTGNVTASISATEADEASASIPFFFIDVLGLAGTNFVPTVVVEPDGSLSDIFGTFVGDSAGDTFLAFASDVDSSPMGPPSGGIQVSEGSGVFDATQYLNPTLIAEGYTAQFVSDTTEVPEPSSLLLLALGLGALGLIGVSKSKLRRA